MVIEQFQKRMQIDGYFIFENYLSCMTSPGFIQTLLKSLERSYEECRRIQIKNKVDNSEGTCHHLLATATAGNPYVELLSHLEGLREYFEYYFSGKYILNSFGGNILKKGSSYANEIHRDQRTFSGDFPLMLNTIVMLDDFTKDNGATWLMQGGHRIDRRPDADHFDLCSVQMIAPAGSVIVFNSNLWHRAGKNKTNQPRRSLTPIFSRPFVKPGFNHAQFVSSAGQEWCKQILGYYSRIPTTLNEWYQPKPKRFYQEGQG